MPEALDYAPPTANPRRIMWDRRADGVVVTLPTPSVGLAAVQATVVLLCYLAALGVFSGGCIFVIVYFRAVWKWPPALVLAVIAKAIGAEVVRWVRNLRHLPLTGRQPTTLAATPDGIVIRTARWGPVEEIIVHSHQMTRLGVFPGGMTLTLQRMVYVVIFCTPRNFLGADKQHLLMFTTREPEVPGKLEAFLRGGLRLPPRTQLIESWEWGVDQANARWI